jgi:hypothetical protein
MEELRKTTRNLQKSKDFLIKRQYKNGKGIPITGHESS